MAFAATIRAFTTLVRAGFSIDFALSARTFSALGTLSAFAAFATCRAVALTWSLVLKV